MYIMGMGKETEKRFFENVDYGSPEGNLLIWLLFSIKRLFSKLSKTIRNQLVN